MLASYIGHVKVLKGIVKVSKEASFLNTAKSLLELASNICATWTRLIAKLA